MSVNFQVNGKPAQAHAETDTPLLWVLRDELGMTGTKFGCGAALCGAGRRGSSVWIIRDCKAGHRACVWIRFVRVRIIFDASAVLALLALLRCLIDHLVVR